MIENLTGKRVTYEEKELLDTFGDDSFRSGDRWVYRDLYSMGMAELRRRVRIDFAGHVKPGNHNDHVRIIDQHNDRESDRRRACDRHIPVFVG